MSTESPETINCVRCSRQSPSLPKPPLPGPTGEEIQRQICPDCWSEWQRAEVMVINELRLNFMEPRSLEILEHHMREFLMLSTAEPADGAPEATGP